MKKISCLLVAAFAVCSIAWAGSGTENDPYTIAEAVALSEGATEYWAQGYIVGGAFDNFDSPWTSDYSISCADTDSESDVDNCLQVKLESDGGRTTWGLSSDSSNFQKLIKFKGFRDAYGGKPSFEGVDNADISEVALGDQPPVIESIGNKSVVWSNALSFDVSASDSLDGDSIVLSATELPSGATFASVTNAGGVTNTFSWADAGPMGVYTTTFWAVDNDGTNSETITITVGDGSSPADIAWQGFENTAADTWTITAGDGSAASESGSADTPVNQRIRTDTTSWQPGTTDETVVELELGSVDVSSYSDVMIELHMSATCTNYSDGYGMYPSDAVTFSVALNGGAYHSDLIVTGNTESNEIVGVLWGMDATGVAATTAGVARTMAPTASGVDPAGLATIQIYIPDGSTSVKLKASVAQEYYGYFWNIDDIALNGVNDGGASDFPPAIAVSPAGTSKSVEVSNNLSFVISGTEIPNDSADTVTLRATGLPSGATFAEVSGTSVLTNTFSWTPTSTGTTVVSFFAGDKDGTNQVDVTIDVYEQQPAGTYRAVICGISDYDGTINDLDYCDDDAQDLYDLLLTGSNWEASNMQLLLDSQATESNIYDAITTMGNASVDGDVCLFYFSGHGGDDVPDTDGDEGGDGYDEYLCPYYLMDQEITDDELGNALDALPTDNIIVLLDTCFSGGHLKSVGGLTAKGYSRTGVVVTDRSNGFADDLRGRVKRDVDDLTSPYISTAADDDEYSYEDAGIGHGVYTLYLLDAITNSVVSDTSGDGYVSGEESFTYLYPKVVAYESTQHPQEYDGWPGLANLVGWAVASNQPPTLALDPSGTNKVTAFDTAMSFTVTATDHDGLAVSLSVSNLPSGATAPDDSGTGTAATTFNWTPAEAQIGIHTVTFSATDSDGTTEVTVQITVTDGSATADLLISEYVEGSSNNKYIEIFNGTGGSVDLSDYKLQLYSNGNGTPNSDVTLSGSLANGAVKVYQNSSATLYAGEDNAAVGFNGDDAVALYKISSSSYVDIFGCIGEDPGTEWTSGALSTLNQTLVRKSTVASGVTANPGSGFPTLGTEWDTYAQDTVSNLGSHTFSGGGSPPADPEISNITSPTNGAPMSMQIDTEVGTTYALQCTSNLMAAPPVWLQVDSEPGTGSPVLLEDADSDSIMRYYRVVEP